MSNQEKIYKQECYCCKEINEGIFICVTEEDTKKDKIFSADGTVNKRFVCNKCHQLER